MLDNTTRKRIDDCRDILVGKLPDPKSQIEQITIALIYKFMDDMDKESIELGGTAKFFSGDFEKYSWDSLFDAKVTATEMLKLYSESIESMEKNPNIPQLFRDIFKNAYLPYRDSETLKLFLKTIGEFEYTHSEKLGDAFEYLLSVMGSQGDAGQFRTPRHIIDFIVKAVDPDKTDTILDPACGTAGFLISAFKRIKEKNKNQLTPDERKKLIKNFIGYDISPDMVRLSLVNLYLHGFSNPHIFEYDTLTSEDRWNDNFDVVLANPPFMSPKGGIRPHKKFTVQSNRSEVLFVDYIAEHLNPNGRAGIIVPEGVIFQSGKAYKQLRKMLVENYLYAVVSLPAGVFNPYSGVKTSILLMDKAIAKKSDKVLFVKIENDGYNLGAQRTAIKGGQLGEAIDIIHHFAKNQGIPVDTQGLASHTGIAHAVAKTKIAENGEYNLSGERYKTTAKTDSDWPFEKLGNNIDFISGLTLSIPKSIDKNGTPIISMNSILENGTLIDKGIRKIKLPSKKINFLEKGDLLFNWRNGSKHLVGKTAYFDWEGSYVFASFLLGIRPHKEKYNSKFLWSILNYCRSEGHYMQYMRRNVNGLFNREELKIFKAPLPPLSIQKEIVAEIEGYQKIIDGAKMVVESYKPQIDIDADWEMVELSKIIKLSSGKGLTAKNMIEGPYPVYGGNDINGYHNEYFLEEPTIVIGRVGAYCGVVHITQKKSWVTDNGLYVTSFLKRIEIKFLSQLLSQLNLNRYAKVGGQPSISQKTVTELKISVPDLAVQKEIVNQLEKEQKLINSNKQLIKIFEQKIKDRIAKVWGTSTTPVLSGAEGLSTSEDIKEEKEILSMAAEPEAEYLKK
jgi:type I restriction enzyme M protein